MCKHTDTRASGRCNHIGGQRKWKEGGEQGSYRIFGLGGGGGLTISFVVMCVGRGFVNFVENKNFVEKLVDCLQSPPTHALACAAISGGWGFLDLLRLLLTQSGTKFHYSIAITDS